MYTTTLRTVGGSVMFAIPKPMLEGLELRANQQVGISISEGRMIVEPKVRRRYTLEELLAQCDPKHSLSAEEREWLDMEPAGREEE